MTLLIDNYDSFTYNLMQLLGTIDPDIRVIRNDAADVADIRAMAPARLVLSPGPGHPKDAGICEEAVKQLTGEFPILGVCLGHQAICEAFGAHILPAARLMHGKQSLLSVDTQDPLFNGLPAVMPAARYHSLAVDRNSVDAGCALEVIARDEEGEVMAVRHKDYPLYGLQFHPESILTPDGAKILRNFMQL